MTMRRVKMQKVLWLVAVLAAGVGVTGVARAADKEWKFNVINKSNGEIVEFRTQEDGEWSENWISDRISAGDEEELDFESDEGKCTVRTQIRFTDGTYFDADVDYCKADTLEIYDQTLVWKAAE